MIDQLSADQLLTTTRSVRRRLDVERPVPPGVIAECIDVATQAPTGGNRQNWAFVVVRDSAKRAQLAELYQKGIAAIEAGAPAGPPLDGDDSPSRSYRSAQWLVDHLAEVPVHVIPCVRGRITGLPEGLTAATTYGSILPAVWSFMLAARARRLGTSWTTGHLFFEAEAAELLGLPADCQQTALIPTAYYVGDDFRPPSPRPGAAVTHWDSWGVRQP